MSASFTPPNPSNSQQSDRAENAPGSHPPRDTDAVLGGNAPPPIDAAVLGGSEGIQKHWASDNLDEKILALKQALKAGKAGLESLCKNSNNEFLLARFVASYALQHNKGDSTFEQLLQDYPLWQPVRTIGIPFPRDIRIHDACGDYQLNAPVPASSTAERLLGFWNYKVSIVSATYRIKIEFNETDKLIGHYIIPSDNDSLFEFAVYDFPGRGRPVITIAQIAQRMPNSSYRAALSGRLDNECLITGDFVDVDANRGTFKMMKL